MQYNADMSKEKRIMIEGTQISRQRLRILAVRSNRTMRDYIEWLAAEAEKREMIAPTVTPAEAPAQPSTEAKGKADG